MKPSLLYLKLPCSSVPNSSAPVCLSQSLVCSPVTWSPLLALLPPLLVRTSLSVLTRLPSPPLFPTTSSERLQHCGYCFLRVNRPVPMSSCQGRGEGFVHPNTPASIAYTRGQKLSFSDLRRRSSRVECVSLPASQSLWRLAAQCYTAVEGYTSFASDLEDERAGDGPVLPPVATVTRKRPRYHRSTGEPTHFFVGRRTLELPPVNAAGETASTAPTSAAASTKAEAGTPAAAGPSSGISIITHHKVSGRGCFIYPDYDGVLSGGVVPEVVASAEELREEERKRKFFMSPSDMTAEEQEAFEALQKLWQARARSHSAQGAQWRAATEAAPADRHRSTTGSTVNSSRHMTSDHAHTSSASNDVEEETVGDPAERDFTEALRIADELLRFI